MHAEVARIFVGVERRIKTGKLRTIDTEPPHVGSRRPLRVPGHTHAAHTRQRHPTSRAFLHGVLSSSLQFSHSQRTFRSFQNSTKRSILNQLEPEVLG
ncbi:hypothetical protein QLX08_002833 [Tetragonisca angustula]|uniref:Uncharacterized protein n=1 Tax=Tetragonisca angustula TaxID=166442 RepID=A0AAW1ABX4_9HYME